MVGYPGLDERLYRHAEVASKALLCASNTDASASSTEILTGRSTVRVRYYLPEESEVPVTSGYRSKVLGP